MIAATRTARQNLIVDTLAKNDVRSQSELAELLAAQGVSVTQATLSRDLVEVGAVKVRADGGSLYAVPGGQSRGGDRIGRLRRICLDQAITATASANLVVLRTPPGAANFVASAIDLAEPPDVNRDHCRRRHGRRYCFQCAERTRGGGLLLALTERD